MQETMIRQDTAAAGLLVPAELEVFQQLLKTFGLGGDLQQAVPHENKQGEEIVTQSLYYRGWRALRL